MPEGVVRLRLAVAVTTQIEPDDVGAVEQAAREIAEGVRIDAKTVHDDERRGADHRFRNTGQLAFRSTYSVVLPSTISMIRLCP